MPSGQYHLVCLGFGYTAKAFAAKLREEERSKTPWKISGTSRNLDKAETMEADGVLAILINDEEKLSDNALMALHEATHLLISMPPHRTLEPGKSHCPALNLINHPAINLENCSWVGYLSSNGVYGDHKGAWVDEDTAPIPTGPRGKARLAAEKDWRSFGQKHNLPITIFRLPGIYGPGRSAIDSLQNGKAKRVIKPGQVFNRMHVDDIASALHASLIKTNLPDTNPKETSAYEIFNLCDDEASPPQDVITYAANLIGVKPPPEIPIEDANLSPMGLSFYRDNKRVSNARMKAKLNIELQYPSYREGLKAIKQGYQ